MNIKLTTKFMEAVLSGKAQQLGIVKDDNFQKKAAERKPGVLYFNAVRFSFNTFSREATFTILNSGFEIGSYTQKDFNLNDIITLELSEGIMGIALEEP